MDAIKRASFASKQVRAGPAPLASFEDLPSDELESPEELTENPIYRSNAVEDESGSSDAHLTTPDSLTISSQSTPRIECDFDSHFTLTPSEPYEGQSSSELRTISLSSLSKESSLNVKPKKGSAVSLGTIETPEPEYTQRKSSWTDIFKSHNQNNVKSGSCDTSSDKTLKKKSREELPTKDQAESKSKEKGKFLSFFKKKTNKTVNTTLSPEDFIMSSETVNIMEPEEISTPTPKITNGNVPKGKENELPNSIEVTNNINIVEAQNDLGKINVEKIDKIPDERKINRKLINICEKSVEKEYNILSQPEIKQLDKVSKTENIQAIVHNIDQESSESELAFQEKDETETISEVEKKEDDYEAETLLTPDISEIEEDQVIELQPVSYEISKQVLIPSRQQRLEVTTKPIDRPRSTTPINAASLEAFIRSASPTSQTNVEKIKLSLPGEQFLGRVKSPKKSAVKSWSDFCEKGLSPRMYKRNDDDNEGLFSVFEGANFPSQNVPFTDSDPNWAAFESDFASSDNNRFSDNFSSIQDFQFTTDLNDQIPQRLIDPYQPFETNFFSCSCECHKQVLDQTDSGQTPSTEIDKKNCSCQCQLEMKDFENFKPDFSSNLNNCDVANVDTVVLK